jgi:hypothetical protein
MTRRVFSEHGVGAACSLGLALDADVSSDDSSVVARGAAELDKALTFASAVGAGHLCGILYSALAKYPAPPTKQGRVNCVRELQVLANKAADKGVKVCLEVVNRCADCAAGEQKGTCYTCHLPAHLSRSTACIKLRHSRLALVYLICPASTLSHPAARSSKACCAGAGMRPTCSTQQRRPWS